MRDLLHYPADIVFALYEHLEERLIGYHADDIIKAFFVNRQTRVHLAAEKLLYLVDSGIYLGADNLHAGDKYLIDRYLVEFESALYELAFLLLDNAFLFYLIYHVFELVLGNRRSLAALREHGRKQVQRPHERFQHDNER